VMTITKLRGAEYLLRSVADGVEDYFMGAGEAPGVWHGRWAEQLGLVGVVEADVLRAMVDGHHPTSGEDLLAGNKERVVKAIDLTLSAPKSVSLLWAFGDEATTAAVSIAVAEASTTALDFLESRAAVARQQVNGVRRQVETGGFAVAQFTHRTSRAGDPQLHVHCLLPNMVERADGSHVAIDASPIHEWLKASGTVFQAELQRLLTQELGVVWGPERNGCREMVGFDRAQLRAFSKRTVAIETVLEAGPEAVTAKERMKADDRASLQTRDRKNKELTPEALRERWADEATRAGITPGPSLARTLQHQAAHESLVDQADVFAALIDPDTGMCATKARFGRAHVVERVAAQSAGRWTTSEIETLAEEFLASDLVVRLATPTNTRRRKPPQWSTVEHRALEDRVLVDLDHLRAITMPGAAISSIEAGIGRARVPLGGDQADAVRLLTGEGPALRLVLAAAGYGKTALTTTAAGIAEADGRPVLALAATNKAVAELRAAGLEASTIARWRLDATPLAEGAVVVLDEVSQVSTRDAAAVLDAVTTTSGAQLWCLGDQDQGRSVKPGGLAAELARLDQAGEVTAAELTVNRRQSHPAERAALAAYRTGRLAESQTIRADQGWEHQAPTPTETRNQLADAAVADLLGHGTHAVVVLAVSHADCEDLADRIRRRLRAAGHIRGPEVTGPGWGPDDRRYAAGDRVLVHTNTHVDGHRLTNGTTATVVDTTPAGGLISMLDDGPIIELPAGFVAGIRPDGNPNLSHAWARTIDGAQGGTWDHVHLLATPNIDRHTLYVGQSRGRQPTHTWNTLAEPDSEIHGNVVADGRGPDEIVLAAAARRPDTAFAAWDDPNVLDRQLRAERAEHETALAAGPPDYRAALEHLARKVDDLTAGAHDQHDTIRHWERVARQTGGPRVSRDKRQTHRRAVDNRDRAAEQLDGIQHQLRDARSQLASVHLAQSRRERWEHANAWRHDAIADLDDRLDRHWAETVLSAAVEGDPLAHGLDRLRHAVHTLADDPSQPDHHQILRAALDDHHRQTILAVYRGDHPAPDRLTDELGPLPEPGPGRAAWAGLALRVEHRADTPPAAEPESELSLLERRWNELGRPTPIPSDRLIMAADNLPLGRLTDAGPEEWNIILDQAEEVIHRQLARRQERDFGLSL
jgi:conjugative relaxase-like TrwC/TraI family protein